MQAPREQRQARAADGKVTEGECGEAAQRERSRMDASHAHHCAGPTTARGQATSLARGTHNVHDLQGKSHAL